MFAILTKHWFEALQNLLKKGSSLCQRILSLYFNKTTLTKINLKSDGLNLLHLQVEE